MFENVNIGTLMGSFYPKKKMYELKIYRGVLCTNFEEKLTCQFKIDMRNLTNFEPSTQKSQKLTLYVRDSLKDI